MITKKNPSKGEKQHTEWSTKSCPNSGRTDNREERNEKDLARKADYKTGMQKSIYKPLSETGFVTGKGKINHKKRCKTITRSSQHFIGFFFS